MNNLVYMRMQKTNVEMETHKAKMAMLTIRRFSGLTKFGRTPGGGAKAGLSSISWTSVGVAIVVSGGKVSKKWCPKMMSKNDVQK